MTLIKQPTPENILLAARSLKDGALIGLPTETVYGLAADAENERAVRRIYEVKGRPLNHPVIVHIGSIEYMDVWAKNIPHYAQSLAETFWPGPLTLILHRSEIAKNFVTGGQNSIGIRIPNHKIALSIIKTFHELGGKGIAAPSANIFSKVSPTTSIDVEHSIGSKLLKEIDIIVDGGKSSIGIESTIIDCTGKKPNILRKGKFSAADFDMDFDNSFVNAKNKIRFSGNYDKHYAPDARILVNEIPLDGDGYIGKSIKGIKSSVEVLLQPINTEELGEGLYEAFLRADKLGLKRIIINTEGFTGVFMEAILDRVKRATND